MTPGDFNALFDQFAATVFRLETLPAYMVGGAEQERVQAFLEGRPRPERSVRTSPWMARIAATTAAGKNWSRLRVVDNPLTDYQRYQLESYRESQSVGEQIFIVARDQVGDWVRDFWLFDQHLPTAHAVLMRYSPDGALERRELVDSDGIEHLQLWRIQKLALRNAVPLNTFVAEVHCG